MGIKLQSFKEVDEDPLTYCKQFISDIPISNQLLTSKTEKLFSVRMIVDS